MKTTSNITTKQALTVALLAVLAAGGVSASSPLPGVDWYKTFRPAALSLAEGHNPYTGDFYFWNPTWLLPPLIPLAWLPANLGRGMMFILGLSGFALAIQRLGARPPALVAFLLSPPVVGSLISANIDWLPILGARRWAGRFRS